ncbi:hypothetical protein IFM58399_08566 [Aspergillus lentulus]|uniref:C2H2-type domain-containing protein n=1 Tax=Aspergillus lentulus TaxID=293939 RepID=A0ABQ0ZZA2_ASPLE|nr:uncharacterized protein IFM58399_08566 [Aspergillus lentulus]GFF49482.1 hypothetical protein IFM58399_08566 [Aspergillus lentulus]GFF63275.1 hypothetical protein IFM62136_05584 [Aspergillus lentulus]GFF69792.1 hypothetical protein IFM60648_03009 [Aspergillus lentulus]GFF82266.1 hypothetical protein IFM47457_05745 [Aspergillus lentulus]GFG05276.1 hypothetical protein IFM61392_03752 [Aspergillus lentulus]
MSLGPHLYYDGEDYKCLLCDRWFETEKALYDHCRYTSRHEWCETCLRVFVSTTAKNQHLFSSPVHSHICTLCASRPRFDTAWELKAHRVDYHNLCDICGKYFNNENDLRMHRQRHQARNLQCYGCYQFFKTFSGMLIHLESGRCPSGTDIDDINRLARECYQSRKYIDTEGDYVCPGCDKFCSKLSGLFQHVEDSLSCSYLKESGQCLAKLEHYISWKVQR